jgi:aldehyde dehydrogenase (NAD+)
MSDEFQVAATPIEAIPGIIAELNASFQRGKTLPIEWRKEQLRNLWKLIDV